MPEFVVGIGASAGGLEALEQLFHALPTDTHMAFVVVQHLSPDFESVMDELLIRQTQIRVQVVRDGMPVEANTIYLIPPRKVMIISEGRLLLTDKDPGAGLALPIDQFFRSLAQDVGERSVGVVLSGTGSDGSRGIREIHDAGGLVIVQSERTARFDGMPRSARATGVVDLVLAPVEIAEALVKYAAHVGRNEIAPGLHPPTDSGLEKLMRLLRDGYGIDFSQYRQSTVKRRIERRLLLARESSIEAYVESAAAHPEELSALYRDLLIGVTQFFRDPEAFALLEEQVLPEVMRRVPPNEEIRIWAAGCATGEEAYSLAILLHEQLSRLDRPLNLRIFATDVHPSSLEIANAGLYGRESLANVSPERLRRYFTPKGDQYQISPDLRQLVVFAPHNLIKDPPFTRLDLVTCRNLLIYLEAPAQKKILSLFHFSLKTSGALFLGPSESIGELEDEFVPVDRLWKIYRKRRDVRLPTEMQLHLPGLVNRSATWGGSGQLTKGGGDSELLRIYNQLLARHLPPGVLVDSAGRLIHVFGDAARWLGLRPGRASFHILDLLEPILRAAVSAALQRSASERKEVTFTGFAASTGEPGAATLHVVPLAARDEVTHFLITLVDGAPAELAAEGQPTVSLGEISREHVELLQDELRRTRESLQTTIEELETSNEELQSTNEELIASNEELQSTNEELHSVNEELYTVNVEYQRKVTELTALTDDLNNLLASTEIATLFLDRELNIRRITPQIAKMFNVLPQDVGRRFDNFTHHIVRPSLLDDVRRVLQTGEPFAHEVQDRSGNWHLLRILPYRVASGIEGVVITLVDIAPIKRAEHDLRRLDRQLKGILENAPAFIYLKDLEGRYLHANKRSFECLGVEPDELLGRTDREILPATTSALLERNDQSTGDTGRIFEAEEVIERKGESRTYLAVRYPLHADHGAIAAVAGIKTDITLRKHAEGEIRDAVDQRDRFLAMLSHELRNPLGAIHNAVLYLQSAERGNPNVQKVVGVLERQTAQLARLTDDLLDVSRIAQGRIELRQAHFDLRTSSEEAVEALRALFDSRTLDLQVRLPDEPISVFGDAARLQQIQVNLLVNAAKYTPDGGRIVFQVERDDGEALIRVEDNGVGISADMLPRIFDPFVQAEQSLARAQGGLGLGLTLVRSLVEMHGGRVTASSLGPGLGSNFEVRLPLSPEIVAPRSDSVANGSATIGVGLQIVIIDDNTDARESLQALLELSGHRVTAAGDGEGGLEMILRIRPDIALIDIGLPGLDGYEVARRVRRAFGRDGVVLVAVTGYGQESDKKRAREAGFDEHLTKPVRVARLGQLISSIGERTSRNQTSDYVSGFET